MSIDRPPPVQDLNWNSKESAAFANQAVELWSELLERLPDLPVSRHQPHKEVRSAISMDIPGQPMANDDLIEHLREVVFERSMYPGHPGFLAYISGSGTSPGVVADLLAAGLNQNSGGWRLSPAASEIENELIGWFAKRIGFGDEAGGFVASGGAMANLVGIQLARFFKAGWDVRSEGLAGHGQLRVYTSNEAHVTIDRAAQISGLGNEGVQHIETDSEQRMDIDQLVEAIEADLAAGVKPICVVATAGTTGTGSIDPLQEIASVCRRYGLWMHVDAAYGGPAALTDDLSEQFVGIDQADSLGFDPHKWLYTPLVGACVLVRDAAALDKTFGVSASYVVEETEVTGWGADIGLMTPNFSRGFIAFKIWLSLLAHGWDAYQRRIAHDVALTRYLQALIEAETDLELVTPQRLSIVTFRYVPSDLVGRDDMKEYLNDLNEQIMFAIEFAGDVYPSNAVVDGVFAIRSCIVNHRTEAEQMETLVGQAVELGKKLDTELRPQG